jgi:formylglycine-generating enzyme required for sulfatase activity
MSLATEKIEDFGDQYGEEAIEFACYAAFPLALTTELCYRLREKFAKKLEWWIAPQLLLSGLCEQVRHDLYTMDVEVRLELLAELVDMYGAEKLDEVAGFMGEYLNAAIAVNKNFRLQSIGQPDLVKHFALCLLRPHDSLDIKIKRDLSEILRQTTDPSERFVLAKMFKKQHDFLLSHGFQLMSIAELESTLQAIADNTFNEFDQNKKSVATAVFTENAVETGDAFGSFDFETVTVNDRGEVIDRKQLTAQFFKEPIAAGLEMVAIPSGKFMMGSPQSEHDRYDDENPQHEVKVSSFFMGKYPVTQVQWRLIANMSLVEQELDPEPSDFKGDNLPVEKVLWRQTQEFCARLSRATGRSYRLPTEAEWEYACRAGTSTPFYFGDTITGKLANYYSDLIYQRETKVELRNKTTPVGEYIPNAFGLYDMHGNVWEWCQDHWHSNYNGAPDDGSAWIDSDENIERVLRGGSWDDSPSDCRSAVHSHFGNETDSIGFRVVCEMSND